MNERIINNWNMKVTAKDKVYVIGDFSFGNPDQTKSVYDRLNGEKILIRGNHDNNHTADLFDEVHDDLTIKIDNHDVLLCHYPYKYEDEDLPNDYVVSNGHLRPTDDKGQWLIHGHVHNMWQLRAPKRMINVGVDVWGFLPVEQGNIRNIIIRNTIIPTKGDNVA